MSKDRSEFLKLARARFKQWQDADSKQTRRELEDLRFYAGDQWPEDVLLARSGQVANGNLPPVPARPCLTINKMREPVRQVLNQERQSDMALELVPADDFGDLAQPTDSAEIELREGLVRRIQRESHAADARTWAFARAVIAGRGYYGVNTRYLPGKTFDQEVYIQRFYNQAAVGLDPAHEQPDGSDAEWGFIGVDLPWTVYKAEYPRRAGGKPNPVADASTDGEWRGLGDQEPDWFTNEGDVRLVRVVDYYYIERKARELVDIDGQAFYRDELPKDFELPTGGQTRTVIEKQVKWAKIDGCDDDVLEETDWPSPFIPIIKVLGEELQPYDKERRAEGLVRPGRDSNQGSNFMISKLVETIGLSPIPPWMMAAGQDEGFEAEYAVANTRTLPALHYNQQDINQKDAPPPFRTPVETPIQSLAQAFQMFSEAVRDTTGVPLSMTGNPDPSLRSAKAIKQMIEQGQHGTSNYLDNLARSINYEARIVNSLLKPIYGRPGRMARMVDGNGEAQTAVMGQPAQNQPQGQPQKVYQLTDGTFNVAVKVTKSYDTRRQQEASEMGDLLQAEPQLITWFGDLYFKNQDGPGHTQLSERAKAMLAPPIQALLSGQTPPSPQQLQMQQQMSEMGQELQKLQMEKQAKVVESQADLEKARMDNDTKIKIAEIQVTATLAATQAKIDAENARTFVDAAENMISKKLDLHLQHIEQVHAAQQLGHAHAHEAASQAADQAHERGMAQMSQEHALEQGDQGHQQALEQGQQAAALAPEPAGAE